MPTVVVGVERGGCGVVVSPVVATAVGTSTVGMLPTRGSVVVVTTMINAVIVTMRARSEL